MNTSHSTISYIFSGMTIFALALGLGLLTAQAAPAEPLTGPTSEPSGATPQDNFYHPLVTTPGGNQEKVGKLGVDGVPANEYDFRVNGNASFLGGIWASAGVFLQHVCIGTPSSSNGICPGGGNSSLLKIFGTFQSTGNNANIQNDALRHTTTLANGYPALERVCSGTSGRLQLCSAGTITSATTATGAGSTTATGTGSTVIGG